MDFGYMMQGNFLLVTKLVDPPWKIVCALEYARTKKKKIGQTNNKGKESIIIHMCFVPYLVPIFFPPRSPIQIYLIINIQQHNYKPKQFTNDQELQ
ncbi:hypothetical protein L1987_46613 [Smallanthus sonchifolius]|uniref:Uncharacterized protein n=1 Tax=Smallanthus sonchifolius TaxID=185202 RepID=A0ACB9G191_9ASTR|nr:hypothetical protein L1987_46613 [Smallanthus sonchifolius]